MILLVEDSKIQRARLSKLLTNGGFTVVEAENGRVALDKMREQQPELILTDLLMPEMDGIQLLEELNRRGSSVPVVVVTADIQDTTRQRCNDLGVVAFFNKPAAAERVIPILHRLVRGDP